MTIRDTPPTFQQDGNPTTPIEDTNKPDSDIEQAMPVSVEPPPQQPMTIIEIDGNDDEETIHWKTSRYAVGKVPVKWSDEWTTPLKRNPLPWKLTALFCGGGKTTRVGNMAVLKFDSKHQEIQIVAGPLWFIPWCVTIPIIVCISSLVFVQYIQHYNNVGWKIGWAALTLLLLLCLITCSLSNPGILPRHTSLPPLEQDDDVWLWNDQALTYRPPSAKYVPICAVVVEGYDHVCPWIGTAIGKGNMKWFQRFLAMIGVCLVYDIGLIWMSPLTP